MRIQTTVLLPVLAWTAAAAAVPAAGSPSAGTARYGWEGTLTVRARAEGAPCLTGVFDTRWTVKVRLEEGRRIDARDAEGRLAGQFVELVDAGSEWSGEETGFFSHTSGTSTREIRYSGRGSGVGPALSCGWLYNRMSDADPLVGTLPNGAYAMASGPAPVPSFDTRTLTTVTDRSGVKSHETSFARAAMLQYGIGQLPLAVNPGRWPDTVNAAEKKNAVRGPGMQGQDRETRAVENDRMSGSFHGRADMGTNLGKARSLHHEVAWDLKRVRIVRARIAKADRFWRPMGGPASNTVTIAAWIEKEENLIGKFRFTLTDVTTEKGWAINAGEGREPDLDFSRNQSGFAEPRDTGQGRQLETLDAVEKTAVVVQASDCGAWGRLKAEVNVDGTWRDCLDADGARSITLPLDVDGDRVADQWETDWSVNEQDASADRDSRPDDVGDPDEPGDGLTLYEEYRGAVVGGTWTELDPRTRDVFVRDEIGLGVGCFADLKLDHHLLDAGEYDGDRVVNFNRGHATAGPQKGIRLRLARLAGICGEVRPGVGSPNTVTEVVIDSGEVSENDAYVLSADLSNTIGHELAHAVNVMHHGNEWATWRGRAADIAADEARSADPQMVAMPGGKWSGCVDCAMVYDAPLFYVGADGILYRFPRESFPASRLTFCSDSAGTGINAGPDRIENGRPYPVAGNAHAGRCRRSVDIKGQHRNGR